MKIKLFFNPQALKNIKPTLQIIYKLLQTEPSLPKVYFVYFIKSKNIRILIDSEKNPVVISLGSQMLNSESTFVLKEDKEMVSIQMTNTKLFFQNLIAVLEKDDQFGLYFDVKKEVLDGKECKFFRLTLKNNDKFLSRILIETPKYDIAEIKFHPWLCGCMEEDRYVEFVIFLDELMNMMRYMIKLKPPAGTKLFLNFDLTARTYSSKSSDPQCLPNTQGEIKITGNSTLKTVFKYQINISDLKVVLQMIRKSKQLKLIISNKSQLVFVHMKEELFVCHTDMGQWIRCAAQQQGRDGGMKIEELEQEEKQEFDGMRWN